VAVPKNALKKWEKVRDFAFALPGATEEFPWGETVAKVNKKVFVFMDADDGSYPLGITVKLKGESAHAQARALTCPGAEPAGIRPGQVGLGEHRARAAGRPAGGAAVRLGGGELPHDRAEAADSRAGGALIPPAAVSSRPSGG
jgi:hypothetical protein